MIGNLVKGQRPRGLINYLLADRDHNGEPRPEAVVIGGTILGDDAYSITAQFTRWMQLNPDARDPIVHESLSPTDGDRKLTHEEMSEIGRFWAESMGFEAYTIFSHGDHLHIAALRIRSNGTLVSTWQDYGRSEGHVREIEEKFNLEKVEASHLLEPARAHTHRRATTKGQAAYIEITGELPPAQRVAAAIDAILAEKPTRDEFEKRLAECGINVRANVASTGKLNGYAYEVGGITVTSKAIGRGYTLTNMQKRGLDLSGVRKHEQNQQSTPTGPREGAGNSGNPEENQRVASSDRVEPRKNITGNQRATSRSTFPRNAQATRLRPADRGGLVSPRSAAHRPQSIENPYELVAEENRTMETVSIAPVAPGPHLQHLPSGPAIHQHRRPDGRPDGNSWWPASAIELAAAGVPLSDIEWWRYQSPAAGSGITETRLRIGLIDGSEIELRHDGVSANRATPAAEAAMIALADRRGWTAVTLSGSDDVKRRLAREMIARGVVVTNPELKEYSEQVVRELATERTAAFIQPAAPAPAKPKLGLAAWRQKKQPALDPVQSVPQALAEPATTGHQVDAPPAPLPTAEQIREAAQAAAALDDVDGAMSYRSRIDAYKLAELAWADRDRGMTRDYQLILDADERGYPWSPEVRQALQLLEKRLDEGDLEESRDAFYEVWLAVDPEVRDSMKSYLEAYESVKEELREQSRPS